MSRTRAWFLAVLSVVCVVGCSVRAPQRPWRGESIEVPDEAHVYSTDPRSEETAAESGAPELEAAVMAELAKRQYRASADRALTATARWLLQEANQRRPLGTNSTDAASRHFGFSGVIVTLVAFDADHTDLWREALAQVPKNIQLNRFGVCASPSGRSFAVIFGSVALTFEPISRFLEPGSTIRLRGEIDGQFSFARVYLTKPDGTVEERKMPSRKLDYATTVAAPGRYKLEVMGDGSMGPVVISNVPLFVGITEPPLTERVSQSAASPAEAEARMLELLNQTRAAARLRPVATDVELREIALGHSNDMVDHEFFSHVSPSTGTPEDRVKRAELLIADYAENIAQAPTPEAAHDGLMESPGHRAAMLGPSFTHVGIAAVESKQGLLVTMLFGRRHDPNKMPRDAAQIEAAFLALRAAKGVSRPAVDPIYRTAAQRGVEAYGKASKPTPAIAAKATAEALRSEVSRLRTSRPTVCTLVMEVVEVEQLERNPTLVAPSLVRFGVGAQMYKDDKGARLATVIVFEGVACK
jgi:uncharacterized protein YkwD